MELGETIRSLRKKKEMTQEMLADEAKVCINTIRRIESGKQFPYKYTIEQIVKALGVTISELLLLSLDDEKTREIRESIYNKVSNDKQDPQVLRKL